MIFNSNATLPVVCLDNRERPPTVSRLVIAVYVDPVHGMLWRGTWPHVSVKRFVRLKPPTANNNAPCAITRVIGAVWIIAALPHSGPSVVFRRLARQRLFLGPSHGNRARSLFAPAVSRFASHNMRYQRDMRVSAYASPSRPAARSSFNIVQVGQKPEGLTREVFHPCKLFDVLESYKKGVTFSLGEFACHS